MNLLAIFPKLKEEEKRHINYWFSILDRRYRDYDKIDASLPLRSIDSVRAAFIAYRKCFKYRKDIRASDCYDTIKKILGEVP